MIVLCMVACVGPIPGLNLSHCAFKVRAECNNRAESIGERGKSERMSSGYEVAYLQGEMR